MGRTVAPQSPGRAEQSTKGASISLDHLVKSYSAASEAAVDDVSLEIEAGEFVSFLGPSGSGKTTTLNMIAGFTPITSGRVLVDGCDVARLPAYRRGLGFVFQHYALFPHMTVAQNVAYSLRRRKVPRAEADRRVEEALALVRLDGLGDRRPAQLSGGQQQRVALARAFVFEPSALLLDEPLGALDRQLREWLQRELKRLHRELSITFVYVTHDQVEAMSMSDRIAVFNRGRPEQVGTPAELYRTPRTLFVAQFLGESTVLRGCRPADASTVIYGDSRLAVPVGPAPGGDVAMVLRPESLSISHHGEGARAEGRAVPVTITNLIYLGSSRRLDVCLPDGREGSVIQAAESESDWRPGDQAWLTWQVGHSVVVPDPVAQPETSNSQPIAANALEGNHV